MTAARVLHHRRINWLRWCIEARLTFKLGLPIAFGMVGQMMLGIADTAMIARVGVLPLAAGALVNTVAHIPLVVGMGMLAAISIRTAHSYGANRPTDVAEWLRHGLLLGALAGLFSGVSLTWLGNHLHRLGQPADVVAAADAYLLLFGWSLLPALISHSAKQVCEALNDPWPPMLILLGGVLLNIFLNWVLIFGRLGAPALGLEGAGIATILARVAMMIASILYVLSAERLRKFRPVNWLSGWSLRRLKDLFQLGFPVAIQHLMEVGAFVFGAIMMGWISADAMAAHQIAVTCAATAFIIALSVGLAVSVRVGHAWGARMFGRLRKIAYGGLSMGVGAMSLCAILFFLGGRMIGGWFVESEPVIQLVAALLIVAGFFQIADGTQVVMISALRGIGDVRVPTAIAALAYWVIALPVAYVFAFPLGYGAVGIWIGLAAGLGTAAIGLTWRFVIRSRPASA